MPQSLLETSQHRLVVSRFDIDHPVRCEPGRGDCRSEQILAGDTPQHAPAGPCRNSCGEECSGSSIDRAISAAAHFVQRAERQPAFRQTLINGLDSERQDRPSIPRPAIKASNALAKRLDNGNGNRCTHVRCKLFRRTKCSLFVLSMPGVNGQEPHPAHPAEPQKLFRNSAGQKIKQIETVQTWPHRRNQLSLEHGSSITARRLPSPPANPP
jgi:hypothetical protein